MSNYKFNLLYKKNNKIGNARRFERQCRMFENKLAFPSPVSYEDIDIEFKKWVENDLEIVYDNIKLPTYNLYSNQRVGEFAQNWKFLDGNGNMAMNFKNITRENNPKKGTIYGNMNVPGNLKYDIGYRAVRQDNTLIGYDRYTMKQPFGVDLEYKIMLVTNKFNLLNQFNELVNEKFKAITCYIFPNEHPMSMILEDISDTSDYTVDDRKFYSQTYSIKVRGYIIRREDFEITHLPIRNLTYLSTGDIIKRKNIDDVKVYENPCNELTEEEHYSYKEMVIDIDITKCRDEVEFEYDIKSNLKITDIELNNIDEFKLFINKEEVDLDSEYDIYFFNGDIVEVKTTIIDLREESNVKFIGLLENQILDSDELPESALDDENYTDILKI
jgi:hypothetical protein